RKGRGSGKYKVTNLIERCPNPTGVTLRAIRDSPSRFADRVAVRAPPRENRVLRANMGFLAPSLTTASRSKSDIFCLVPFPLALAQSGYGRTAYSITSWAYVPVPANLPGALSTSRHCFLFR